MMRLNTACWIAAAAACISLVPSAQAQTTGAGGGGKASTGAPGGAVSGVGGAKTVGGAGGASSSTPATGVGGKVGGSGTSEAATTTATVSGTGSPSGSSSTASSSGAAPRPGAATSASTSTKAAGAAQPLDGSTYVVRLRDLEQRVDELKEQIRRSHTRLSLLSDTILSGGVGGARAELIFKNDLSNAFRVTGAVFVLDGVVQYNRQDESESGTLASQKEIPIFSGSIPPGDHTLQVVLRLRGNGYGVFSYLRGYKFEQKSSHSFTITEGKTLALETIAWEKGDVTTPLEQRPAIRYAENVKSGLVGSDASAPAGRASSSSNSTSNSVSAGASIGTGAK